MIISKGIRFVAILVALMGLAACQATATTPVSAENAASLISGTWAGHFINRKGTRFPVIMTLQGEKGRISGQAKIPDSAYDKAPVVSGTYSGNSTKLETTSGFKYNLTLSVGSDGIYWLKGVVTGRNVGRIEMRRK